MPTGVERPLEVHADDCVEVLLSDLVEQAIARHASVVHQDVQPPVVLDGGADEAFSLAEVGDRVVIGDRLATVLADDRDNLIGWGLRATCAVAVDARVVDHDLRALSR